MAIYQQQGRRVQLGETEISRGFKTQQVYDPSQQTLQESQRRIEQYDRLTRQISEQNKNSVEALSSFSDTLNTFLIEKQKKVNQEQRQLGVADIINGNTKLNPNLYQKYKEQKQYLEAANDATLQVVSEIKPTDPGLAETVYQQAPAVGGWRAVGQAEAITLNAGGQVGSFLKEFLKSDEAISYTNKDGKQETFTPRTALTQEHLSAAWEVGMQKFIAVAGLDQINPVILAEKLTPLVIAARSDILGSRMNEIIQTRENNDREALRGQLANLAPQMAENPAVASSTFQQINKRFIELQGMDRTEGNKDFNEAMRETIRALASTNRFKAEALYQNYKAAPLNAEKPELGTWGSRFDLSDLGTFLQQTAKTQQDEADEKINEEGKGIAEVHFANPNPTSLKDALTRLSKLPQTDKIRALQAELNTNGPYYSPVREQYLVDNAKTAVELEVLKAGGAISDQGYQRGLLKFSEQKDLSKLLPERSSIKGSIRARLKAQSRKLAGVTPEDFADRTSLLTDDFSGRIMGYIMSGLSSGSIKQTPEAVNAAVDKFINEELDAYVATDAQGNEMYLSHPKDARFSGRVLSTVKATDGRTGLQILNAQLDRLPRNLSGISTLRLTSDRIADTVETLKVGGRPPSDIEFFAQRAGISVPELLRNQAKYYPGLQVDMTAINNGNAVYLENRKVNPVIAEALRNPRLTDQQRAQYASDLNRQRLQRDLQAQPAKELNSFAPQLKSVVYENQSGQPGVDLYFEDKQFPVVLPGVVKEINFEPGYGNYVVIESTDPETGEQVDVLYGHLASRSSLRINQQVAAGQLVGRQGGTGNVRSADGTIASIDFLAPAPRGSGSMKPYRNFDRLRRRVVQSLGYR